MTFTQIILMQCRTDIVENGPTVNQYLVARQGWLKVGGGGGRYAPLNQNIYVTPDPRARSHSCGH